MSTAAAPKLSKSALRAIPKEGETIEFVSEFTELDVLLGRGNGISRTPGNLRFRAIVHFFRNDYNRCTSISDKKNWVMKVYDAVTHSGGRFLEVESRSNSFLAGDRSGKFRTTTLGIALEKCAQTLRERKWTPPPLKSIQALDQEEILKQAMAYDPRDEENRVALPKKEDRPKKQIAPKGSVPSVPSSEPPVKSLGRPQDRQAPPGKEPARKMRDSHSLRFTLPLARRRENRVSVSPVKTDPRSTKAPEHPSPLRHVDSEEDISLPEAELSPSDAPVKQPLAASGAAAKREPEKVASKDMHFSHGASSSESQPLDGDLMPDKEPATCSSPATFSDDDRTDDESSVESISMQQDPTADVKENSSADEAESISETKKIESENETESITEVKKIGSEAKLDAACEQLHKPRKSPTSSKGAKTKTAAKGKDMKKKKYDLSSAKAKTADIYKDSFVTTLTDLDVVFGRGTSINNHPGNIRFRELCIPFRAEYASLDAPEKRPFALSVVDKCEGRFLELDPYDPSKYRYVSLARCLEKVCQALRDKSWCRHDKLAASKSRSAFEKQAPPKALKKRKPTGTDELPPPYKKSKPNPTLVASGSQTDTIERIKKGSRVEVYWPMDNKFYEAAVEDLKKEGSPPVDMFFLRYGMDNETEWIDLSQHNFRILDPKPSESKSNDESQPAEKTVSFRDDVKVKTVRLMKEGEAHRQKGRRNLFWTSGCNQKTEGVLPSSAATILF